MPDERPLHVLGAAERPLAVVGEAVQRGELSAVGGSERRGDDRGLRRDRDPEPHVFHHWPGPP